jgi:hypothetical protein
MRLINPRSIVVLLAFLLTTLGAESIATATTWFVAPTGNNANSCLSAVSPCLTIQATVNKAADGDQINVASGSYAEVVFITQRKNLTISGAPGAQIVHPGLAIAPVTAVVLLDLSTRIIFQDLTFTGLPPTDGIRVHNSTGIECRRCIAQGTGGPGGAFFVFGASEIVISDSIIQDNATGIRVDGSSSMALSGAPFSAGTSIVQRNGFGILVRSGVAGIQGTVTLQDNSIGISGQGGTIKSCCQDGLRKFSNNGSGIVLRGDNLDLRGPLEMTGNASFALRMFGGFATISQGASIQNNGTEQTAAIFVTGGFLQLAGSAPGDLVISNNPGNGVTLSDGATARVFNTTISNNGVHGMRVQGLSSAELFDTAVMDHNGGFDFSCTPNSFGHGNDSGIDRMFCHGFDNSPNPGSPNNP